jgi:hypothetical protein
MQVNAKTTSFTAPLPTSAAAAEAAPADASTTAAGAKIGADLNQVRAGSSVGNPSSMSLDDIQIPQEGKIILVDSHSTGTTNSGTRGGRPA